MTGDLPTEAPVGPATPPEEAPDPAPHHGCLTAWVWIAGIAGAAGALLLGLASLIHGDPYEPRWPAPVTAALAFLQLFFIYGIDNSRRWGVAGFVAIVLVTWAIWLTASSRPGPVLLAGSAGILTLCFAMGRGRPDNGWSRLR